MTKAESIARTGAKLVTSGSVQMLIGGLVAAVIPKQISIIFKAASFIGTTVMATYAGSKVDEFIDKNFDDASEIVNEIKENINTIKNTKPKEESGG